MSDFTSVFPVTQALDPNKRVNYLHGLVLGVDEFKQEEFYLLEKDRQHMRSLHGYGTVCGLAVSIEDEVAGTEIKVAPGMALNYCGQVIEVPRTQCAVLEEWLADNSEDIIGQLGSPASGPLTLYLMLCYRECETDLVPIPSGPCQSLEDTTAASRIADDFSLSFSLDMPADYHLNSPMMVLSELLLNIPVSAGGELELDELLNMVRELDEDYEVSSPPQVSSPPLSSPDLSTSIAPENVYSFFHEAFKVWVTEVKPCLMKCNDELIPEDTSKNCVFIAQLDFSVTSNDGLVLLDSDVTIDESQRQFMLASQDQQNYLNPLSVWAKSITEGVMPAFSLVGEEIDESDLVHISGSETFNGQKTFSRPILLEDAGRVHKKIVLPGYDAHHGRGAARALFNELASMHFLTSGPNAFGGEALFSIPMPEDMAYNRGMQFRLVWGFQGAPEPADIEFTWRVGARFYEPGEPTTSYDSIDLTVTEPNASRNSVLVTPYTDFDNSITFTNDQAYGALHISIVDPEVALPEIYLMQVDLRYTADRLGRGI